MTSFAPGPHYHGDGNGCYCEFDTEPEEPEPKLYVLVRKDLGRSEQAVQAIHAAINLVHRDQANVEQSWGQYGPTIALLHVADGVALEHWQARLGAGAVTFYEPDLGNVPTAVGFFGVDHFGLAELRLM